MRRIAIICAAALTLFLPLLGGCAAPKTAHRAYPRETSRKAPSRAPVTDKSAASANFSTAMALDMQAGRLEQIYAYQNMSTGVKQPSLIRDARRLRTQALAYLDRALSEDPGSPLILRRKGYVLLGLADAASAMELYRRAEGIAPADERWYLKAAGQLELVNRLSEAAEVLGWMVRPGSPVPPSLRTVALVEMGGLFVRLDRLDDAEKAYAAALASAPSRRTGAGNILEGALAEGLLRDPTAIRRTLIGILKRRGKLQEALEQARAAVSESPADVRPVLVMSGVYESMGDWANATTVVEQFLKSYPDNEVAAFGLMHVLAAAGRINDAIEAGRDFLASKGQSAAIESEIISIYRKADRYDDAEAFARELEAEAPLDPRIALSVIDMYLAEGKTTEGLAVAARTLESMAGSDKYQEQVFSLVWARTSAAQTVEFFDRYYSEHGEDFAAAHGYALVLRARGDAARAAEIFIALAERGAAYEDVYDLAALRLLDKGDDRAASLIFLKGTDNGFVRRPEATLSILADRCKEPALVAAAVEERLPDYKAALIPACQLIARLYGRAGDNARAEEYYRRTIDTPQPSLSDFAGLAVSLYRQDKNNEAIELVKQLRTRGQGAPPLVRMLVGLLAGEGKYDEALALARDLVRDRPTDVDNHVSLANVYMQKEDYAAAKAELLTAEDLAEGDSEGEANVRYLLGVVYEELGQDDDAVRMWKTNLTSNPDEPDSNNALAYHYAVKGVNLDEALELVAKALALDADNEAYLDTLGWIHYKRGDTEKALAALQRAAAKRDDPVIYDHLGDAYLASGQTDRAIEAWQRALANRPKIKDRVLIEDKLRAHSPERADAAKEETCPDTATGQR